MFRAYIRTSGDLYQDFSGEGCIMKRVGVLVLGSRTRPSLFQQTVGSMLVHRWYSASSVCGMGWEEFTDRKDKPEDQVMTGRAWTVADLRRKSFDDLHKLWYVLYKERNLILSEKEKIRRSLRPVTRMEENRYEKVKRSMAAIKTTLAERKRIESLLLSQSNSTVKVVSSSSSS